MDRKSRITALAAFVIGAYLLDILSTYAATPDLSKERNPLVSSFGWGWSGVLLLSCIMLAILLLMLRFHGRNEPKGSSVDMGLSSRLTWYITGMAGERGRVNWRHYLAFLGMVLPLGNAVSGLCNAALNMGYRWGWIDGLTDHQYTSFQLAKLALIAVVVSLAVIRRCKALDPEF